MCRELKIKNGDFEKEMEEQTKKLEEIKKKFQDFWIFLVSLLS